MHDKLLSNASKLESYSSQSVSGVPSRPRQQEINVAVSIEHKQILNRLQQIRSLVPSCIYTQLACDNVSLAIAQLEGISRSERQGSTEFIVVPYRQKCKKSRLKLPNLLKLFGSWRSQNLLSKLKLYNLSILATIAGEFLISSNTNVEFGFFILMLTSGVFWIFSLREKQKKKFVSLFFLFFLLDVLGFCNWVLKPLFY